MRKLWAWVLVLSGVLVRAGLGQPADTVLTAAAELARFEAARALAVDPSGMLYVADAGRDVVYRLLPTGRVLDVLGGPGAAPGEFDDPVDVDPTNGLVLVVADYGNRRVQRFSREFRFLGTLPAGGGRGGRGQPEPPAFPGGAGRGAQEAGRPAAVVTTPSDETFVLDEDGGVVLKWDAAGGLERVIGGYDAGEGTLAEPVALAVDPRAALYVGDRGRGAVLVYDLFGSYMRSLAEGLAGEVQAIAVEAGRVWIVLPQRLLVYEARGRLVHVADVRLPEPLVDVARHGGVLYALTATRLYRLE